MRYPKNSHPSASFRPVRLSQRALAAHYGGFVRSLRHRKPETRGTYERALRPFMQWFAEDRRCWFRVDDLERYKAYLTRRRHLSEVSVSTYLTALRRFCQYLVRMKVLSENPSRFVRGNKRPSRHSRRPLTGPQVERLLAVLQGNDERAVRDAVIVLFMLRCGLSEIEIVRADRGDLSERNGQTTLAVQGKGVTGKTQVVLLPEDVQEMLRMYLRTRSGTSPSQALVVSAGKNRRGKRMSTRAVRDRVNELLERAGLRSNTGAITPFSLRHTAALLMARGGATAEEIRTSMRLGTVATARLYLEQINDESPERRRRPTHGVSVSNH
jgi:integrase/recombinase XerC